MYKELNTELVWNSFSDELFPFIRKRVKDDALASDILQEVFIKIHQKLDKLKDENKLSSWVYTITRNTINDHFRGSGKIQYSDVEAEMVEDESQAQGHSFEECLIPFINCLPEHYREALMQTEIRGYSQKEYAKKAGISYSGAKSRVQRAKKELKKLFIACCNPKSDAYGNIIEKQEVPGFQC